MSTFVNFNYIFCSFNKLDAAKSTNSSDKIPRVNLVKLKSDEREKVRKRRIKNFMK